MECVINTVNTDTGDIVIHYLFYPNGSVFLWVFYASDPDFRDFHTAVPDKYSSIPAISTRIGETDSTGRFLAMKLSKKMGVPIIVSWSLPETVDASDQVALAVESRIFQDIKSKSSSSVSKHSPAVVGA